jgi:endonuclease/exonuclease/phosphatase family metal-dependent hydrolase
VSNDPSLIAECGEIRRALRTSATLDSLHAAPSWPALRERIDRVLGTVRRAVPPLPHDLPSDRDRVRSVHWNIEHGNRYEQVEHALKTHPQLAQADLVLLNEVDLGMARSGNRDVAGDLAQALGLHAAWAPLFIETTAGRDEDPHMARDRENQEGLFGQAILSRWPIGGVRVVELPSPSRTQFHFERMYGRHIGLVADIERPGGPLVAVSVHLAVHGTRAFRAAQMRILLEELQKEIRPILIAGDFNSHTFDRGRPWDPLFGAAVLLLSPGETLERRLLHPDQGATREPLFDVLRSHGFEWSRFMDRRPTLRLRFARLPEARPLLHWAGAPARRLLSRVERRAGLRLDWFAGRGWSEGRGATVHGLDGPARASDHAPILAEFG